VTPAQRASRVIAIWRRRGILAPAEQSKWAVSSLSIALRAHHDQAIESAALAADHQGQYDLAAEIRRLKHVKGRRSLRVQA